MSKLKLEEGIYYDVTPEEYHAFTKATTPEGIEYQIASKSMLSKFHYNPEKWKAGALFKKSKAMDEGNILDCMILTPKELDKQVIMLPIDAPKKPSITQINAKKPSPATVIAIAWWRGFEVRAQDKIVVSAETMRLVTTAANKVKTHPIASNILANSKKQVVVIRFYKGIWLKCMIDIVPDGDKEFGDSIIDLKRTGTYEPALFGYTAKKFKYDWQAWFYTWMYNGVTGEERNKWHFIISDEMLPNSCSVATLYKQDMDDAKLPFMATLDKYMKCVETNTWPNPYSDIPNKLTTIHTKYRPELYE